MVRKRNNLQDWVFVLLAISVTCINIVNIGISLRMESQEEALNICIQKIESLELQTEELVEEVNRMQTQQSVCREEFQKYKAPPVTYESYEVPNIDTGFKAYMDYRTITDTTTPQWDLQQIAVTDEYGLRKVNDDFCVAVGSYYSSTIGDRFKVILDNGNEFTVIVAELKQDRHTNSTNQYSPVYKNGELYSANVLEFIVDKNVVHSTALAWGTISYYEEFKGNILSMENIIEEEVD